jgi:molybdate transport system regulatory protein
MRVRARVWIERDGEDVFGGGRFALLVAVRRTGSLNRAAHDLEMSYRAAWRKVRECETRLGFPLLEGSAGGRGGGGSKLTVRGERLLAAYERFESELTEQSERLFRKHLGFLDETGEAEGREKRKKARG